jgi:hypothetical protein
MKNLIISLSMILVSCSQTQKEGVALPETAEKKEMIAGKPAASYVAPTNEFSIDRKLIKEGFITMEVKNLQNSRSEIKKLTTEFNAYISNESQSENETRNEANFTIRIPFNSYVKIDVSNLTAVDITEEFIDIEARLKTKKALESRYLGLLSQTKNVSEIINIESELEKVRSDIESMESRIKLLGNQSSYSTLQLTIYEIKNESPNIWRGVGQALAGGWMAMMKFALILIRLWPVLIGLVVILYFGKKRFRNQNK